MFLPFRLQKKRFLPNQIQRKPPLSDNTEYLKPVSLSTFSSVVRFLYHFSLMLEPLKNPGAWNLDKAVTNLWSFICTDIKAYLSNHPPPEPTISSHLHWSPYISAPGAIQPSLRNGYYLEWPCPPVCFGVVLLCCRFQAAVLQLCVPGSQLWLEIQDKHGNKSKADCLWDFIRGSR